MPLTIKLPFEAMRWAASGKTLFPESLCDGKLALRRWHPRVLPQITGHLSVPCNPDLTHVLYMCGFMEKLGRGSVLILQECQERGLPTPRWASAEKSGVTSYFLHPGSHQLSAHRPRACRAGGRL